MTSGERSTSGNPGRTIGREPAAETDGGTQMAHVGTQMTQPKAASAPQTSSWGALLTAILVIAIAVGFVMATAFLAGSNVKTGVPASEKSYTQVENLRGTAPLSGVSVDRTYDNIEDIRGGAFAPATII